MRRISSSFYHLYGGAGWNRDFTMPFTGGWGVYECGIFYVHIGMAGYGVYELTGSQTIIGIVMDGGTYYS